MLSLHDTALGEITEIDPRNPGEISIYVCGPTVYDVPHLGHGRSVLVYDILRRYLEWCGISVVHVSNVTDIDDKIVARAVRESSDASTIATRFEGSWWEAVDALGVLRPTHAPRATEYVERMVVLIGSLIEAGYAYETPSGVWFASEKLPGYGLLARQSLDSLRSGARVEVEESKRSPIDFALWKRAKESEPSWPSPWGAGRPGWHTECVVMSLDLLGDGFDIHSGGMDLQFPHHENERAQAVALGHRFSRHWMHHAFVEVGGEKMSKSLDNYTSLTDLIERNDPRALRLLVLRAHYRSPVEVTPESIADATEAVGRLDALARRSRTSDPPVDPSPGAIPASALVADEVIRFREAMDDDLDTPRAVAILFDIIRHSNTEADAGRNLEAARLAATAFNIAGAVGLFARTGIEDIPPEVAELANMRFSARASKDWTLADKLRDEMADMGWVVEDGPSGRQDVYRSANT